MPSLLTVDEVRDSIETDLVDGALELVVDAADAEIIRRLGPLATQPETQEGGSRYLHLARAASAIVSISERYMVHGMGFTTLALVDSDWRLLPDGRKVERLTTGTNPSSVFQGEVSLVATPLDTTAERSLLLINLVKLELGYTGHLVQSSGDIRVQSLENYADAKAALFRSLGNAGRRLIA